MNNNSCVFPTLLFLIHICIVYSSFHLDGSFSDWTSEHTVQSESGLIWRFYWNESDFWIGIDSGASFGANKYLFVAFDLEPIPTDNYGSTPFTYYSAPDRVSLNVTFLADVILVVEVGANTSALYIETDVLYAADFAFVLSGSGYEARIRDPRFSGSMPARMFVAGYTSTSSEAFQQAPPTSVNFFGFLTDPRLFANDSTWLGTTPYGTAGPGDWRANSTWIGSHVPVPSSPYPNVVLRHQVSLADSKPGQVVHLTVLNGGKIVLTNSTLTIGAGSTSYLNSPAQFVEMDSDSYVELVSPLKISGSDQTLVNLVLSGISTIETTITQNITIAVTGQLEFKSEVSFAGPNPIMYHKNANLWYSDGASSDKYPGLEWLELENINIADLNSDEQLSGVPTNLHIGGRTYVSVLSATNNPRAVRESIILDPEAVLTLFQCFALVVPGNITMTSKDAKIVLRESTLKTSSIQPADANITCDETSQVVINNEIPWPFLTLTDPQDRVIAWKENVTVADANSGIRLDLSSAWSEAFWFLGNQSISDSSFLLVTTYGDYRVEALHTSTNCKSFLQFSVVPTTEENFGKKSSKGKVSTVLIIAIAVPSAVVLAAASLFAFWILRSRKKKDEKVVDMEMKGKETWEIDYNELTISKELGRGAFGVVYLCRWRNTDCVVKQLDTSKTDLKSVKQFLKEANNVKELRSHPNVCTIFGVCTKPEYPTCIVMEFVPGGSLEEFLYKDKLKITAQTVIEWGKDIASGMGHLHKENVLHCDLAARNLLVNPANGKYVLKIADFGLSRVTNEDTYNASDESSFPIRWTAPETLRGGKISRASDVWSFGVVLWEIIECKRPYPDLTNKEVMHRVCDTGERLAYPQKMDIPKELWNLMQRCWMSDPDERPSFNDIYTELEHIQQMYYPTENGPAKEESDDQNDQQPVKQTEYNSAQYATTSASTGSAIGPSYGNVASTSAYGNAQ